MEFILGTPSRYSKSKMISANAPSLIPKGSYFLLLKKNGITIGSLIAEKYENAYTIRKVEVSDEYRGKGYGKQLMKTIIEFLKPKQLNIILYVDPFNTIATSLYSSLGFKRIKQNTAFGDKYLLPKN